MNRKLDILFIFLILVACGQEVVYFCYSLALGRSDATSTTNPLKTKHLVLIGGGHAHLQVIKEFHKQARPKNVEVTLIDKQKCATYSGMVPGCISKLYSIKETEIELTPLANWAGINFIHGRVTDLKIPPCDSPTSSTTSRESVDQTKSLLLEDGTNIKFDVISFDIGSTSRGLLHTEGAMKYAIPTRPISSLQIQIAEEEEKLLARCKDGHYPNSLPKVHVVVVGSGAAGIELAMAIRSRWGPILQVDEKEDASISSLLSITLLNSGSELLSEESKACKAALNQVLDKRGVKVRHESNVTSIQSNSIHLSDGSTIGFTHCLWATGAAAHSLAYNLGKRGLSISDRGWIQVSPTLQTLSHPYIFAAGDCATIENLVDSNNKKRPSPPKAGVYAVRSGPILIENLAKQILKDEQKHTNSSLASYDPQNDFLKLIMCGDGTALGFRFGLPLYGKWVWQLKDTIDKAFMDLFRVQNLPDFDSQDYNEQVMEQDLSQYDAAITRQSMLSPHEGARLLMRKDDDVDFQSAWDVLKKMMDDEEYRLLLLKHVRLSK